MSTLPRLDSILQRVATARLHGEERARNDHLSSLLQINTSIGVRAPVEQLLTSIAEAATRLLKVDNARFLLVEGSELVLAAAVGTAAETIGRSRMAVDDFVGRSAVAHGQPVIVDLRGQRAKDAEERAADERLGYVSVLAAPLSLGERIIGVLEARARRPFTKVDVDVAQALAGQAAVAVEHARLHREVARRAERLQALSILTQGLSETLDPDTVGERISRSICSLLDVAHAAVYRADADSRALVLLASTVREGEALPSGFAVRWGHGAVGLAVQRRAVVATQNVLQDAGIVIEPEERAVIERSCYRSVLAVPLMFQDQVVGALAVRDVEGRTFDDDDVELMLTFAGQALLALENARSHTTALDTVRKLGALVDVSRTMAGTLDSREVARAVIEAARTLLPEFACHLWEVTPDREALQLVAEYGLEIPSTAVTRARLGEGLVGLAAQRRKPLVSIDLAHDERVLNKRWLADAGVQSALLLPLLHGGELWGALAFFTRLRHEFPPEEIALLESFAGQVVVAMANARSFQRAEERARQRSTLGELTRLITAAAGSRQVFDAVIMASVRLLGAAAAILRLDDSSACVLRLQALFCADPAAEAKIRELPALPYDRGLAGEVFRTRRPIYVDDVADDPRWLLPSAARWAGLRACAAVPLMLGERTVGVLAVLFPDRRRLSEEERQLLDSLAAQAAIAIMNKQAEEKLRQTHAETEHLVTSIASILVAVDGEGRVVRWNREAEGAFGVSAADVLGRPLAETGAAWEWQRVHARMDECRDGRRPTRLDDLRYARADGKDRCLSLTLTPIDGEAGACPGVLLLATDVTDLRLMEAQLAQAQRLESIGQLAAGIAHEINTPIQFVGDNTRFLQDALGDLSHLIARYQALRDAAGGDAALAPLLDEVRAAEAEADVEYLTAEIPKAVAQTLEGVQRVATIVRALKEFAHPDRREKAAADLDQALVSTLTVAGNEIKYVADVETAFGELPPVVCYAGELNQVFLNIIVNAAHAIGDVVAGTGQRGRIRVRTWREDGEAVIAISDTGGGIPEHARDRIFDPFFTTKAVGRGTGQGLAIARNVVVGKHGGRLTFETQPGQGTTFFVRLPIDGQAGAEGP